MELLEVAGDDGYGEGHDEHPADGAHAPYQLGGGVRCAQPHLAQRGGGEDVPVADGGQHHHAEVDLSGPGSQSHPITAVIVMLVISLVMLVIFAVMLVIVISLLYEL